MKKVDCIYFKEALQAGGSRVNGELSVISTLERHKGVTIELGDSFAVITDDNGFTVYVPLANIKCAWTHDKSEKVGQAA